MTELEKLLGKTETEERISALEEALLKVEVQLETAPARLLDATIETFRYGEAILATVASGVITVATSNYIVAAESGTTDDLDTIEGYDPSGMWLQLRPDSGDTITVKHGTGNIQCWGNTDILLAAGDICILSYDLLNEEWQAMGDAFSSVAHSTVTLAGTPDYITISGQVITRNKVDLTADVENDLPVAEGGTGQSTAQAAIDALSSVSGATDEHVLTKDTATGSAKFKAAAGGGAHTHMKQFVFTGTQEDAQVETLVPSTHYIGESADHGTFTLRRFTVWVGVVGVTGTLTVKLYRVAGPLASDTETEIATVDITTGSNAADTSVAVLSTDKWLRAKITVIHSGTPAKNVNCALVVEEDTS